MNLSYLLLLFRCFFVLLGPAFVICQSNIDKANNNSHEEPKRQKQGTDHHHNELMHHDSIDYHQVINHNDDTLPLPSTLAARAATEVSLSATTRNGNRRRRSLQTVDPKYVIFKPDIELRTFRLNLIYVLTDAVMNQDIKAKVFRDGQCSQEISRAKYVTIDIEPDDTPIDDQGLGFRNVVVGVRIDPVDVIGADIVSPVDESRSIVSFCVQLGLYPRLLIGGQEPINTLNTQINLVMALDENAEMGIVDMLEEDREEEWGVQVFRCNATGQELEDPLPPVSQGIEMRLCISPTRDTLNDGIKMLSISELQYFRGDITQTAVISRTEIGDGGLTEIECNAGSSSCTVISTLQNELFQTGTGIVGCSGTVNLQYGTVGGRHRQLRGGDDMPQAMEGRQLYFKGEYVGTREFYLPIDVAPYSEVFVAEAYRCNIFDEPLVKDNPVKLEDQGVRICIRPDGRARKAGVFMRSIDEFEFISKGLAQPAVTDGKEVGGTTSKNGDTLIICPRGYTVCAIKTDLNPTFFGRDGKIQGTGMATLQFGTETDRRKVRTKVRILQDESSDPSYAGTSPFSVEFNVVKSEESQTAPTYVKVLLVVAIVMGCILCCCFCVGLCLFYRKRGKNDLDNKEMFAMIEGNNIGGGDHNGLNDSMDAFMDSKASFYSDLDFMTDASDDSSDEESITERFEDDLEQKAKIAILFPNNPDPMDLSQRRNSDVITCQGVALSRHGPDAKRRLSLPSNLPSVSDNGPKRRHSEVMTSQAMVPLGLLPSLPNQDQRGKNCTSSYPESHNRPPPARGRLSSSEHGPPRNLAGKGKRLERGADNLSVSEHNFRNVPPPTIPGQGRWRGSYQDHLSYSGHGRGRGRGRMCVPDRLSVSDHGPGGYISRGGLERGGGRARGGRAGRGGRGPGRGPRGRTTGRGGPRYHNINGLTQVPLPGAAPSVSANGMINMHPPQQVPRQPTSIDIMDVIVSDEERDEVPFVTKMEKKKSGESKSSGKKKKSHGGKTQKKRKKKKQKKTTQSKAKNKNLSPYDIVHSGNLNEKTFHSTSSGGSESVESSLGSRKKNKKQAPVPTNSERTQPTPRTKRSSTSSFAVDSTGDTSSVESSLESISSKDDDDDDDIPDEDDVCFEAESHPGTEAFISAVRKTIKKLGPVAYSPKVYRSIKKKLPLRRFFVCDDDNNPFDWREVTKSELIDLVWKYYELEKGKLSP